MKDRWNWSARLFTGVTVHETQMKSLHAVPADTIRELALRGPLGTVTVEFPTGLATLNLRGVKHKVMPPIPVTAFLPKAPLFFRRRVAVFKPGGQESRVEFRALGFAVFERGVQKHIAALRVYDDRVDHRYNCSWPPETARHTASLAVLRGA